MPHILNVAGKAMGMDENSYQNDRLTSGETDGDDGELKVLREEISQVNEGILKLVSRRIDLVDRVRAHKVQRGFPMFDPARESDMFEALIQRARSEKSLSESEVRAIFRPIFEISLAHMEGRARGDLRISRKNGELDRAICINGTCIGGPNTSPTLVAGPCAVESPSQMERVAQCMASLGLKFLRGGAFKPRTNPDAFQGLGLAGLQMMRQAADRHGLNVVSEITDPRQLDQMVPFVDVLQIGARNMMNYALLQEVGRSKKTVILKRAFAATLDEFLHAAEYLAKFGNEEIILCERGIRTFERETRFTFDISAIPLLRQKTALPVMADVSHATGRRDLILPLAKAALAAGASALMVEVHPCPEAALSDSAQQLSLPELEHLVASVNLGI